MKGNKDGLSLALTEYFWQTSKENKIISQEWDDF